MMIASDAQPWAGPLRYLEAASRTRLLVIVAAGIAVAVGLGVQSLAAKSHDGYVGAVLVHGLVYAVAIWVVMTGRLSGRALWVILAAAIVFRVIAFQVPVGLTTDAYRYVWDGRLQFEGVNPYLTVPADARLVHLQDQAIYPNINGREKYPTIYPPLAQISFLLATRISDSIDGVKMFMGLTEAGIILALMAWLATLGLPRERVLIYAWHPLPLWEFTGHGHIDAVAVLCVVLAMLAAARGRTGWAGAAFAGAFLVKYWPVYLAAAVWRRWDWRMPAAALATGLLLTLPYVWPGLIGFGFAGVAPEKLLGSLFTHLDDEGYNQEGWGFFLAYAPKHFGWWDIAGSTYAKFAAAVLVVLGMIVALSGKLSFRGMSPGSIRPLAQSEQAREWIPPTRSGMTGEGGATAPQTLAVVLVTAFLLLISPHYPWYYVMAVPLLTVCLYPPLLWVTLVVSAIYIEIDYVWLTPYPRFKVYLWLYGGFLALAALTWWVRRRAN